MPYAELWAYADDADALYTAVDSDLESQWARMDVIWRICDGRFIIIIFHN